MAISCSYDPDVILDMSQEDYERGLAVALESTERWRRQPVITMPRRRAEKVKAVKMTKGVERGQRRYRG